MIEEDSLEFLQSEFLNSKDIESKFGNQLLNHALFYADKGYPVFPIHNLITVVDEDNEIIRCSCSDWQDCTHQGKHPRTRYGFKEATTDEEIIKDWWKDYPKANIGLITGIESGIFVLDIDWKHGGEYSLDEMRDDYREAFRLKDKEYEPLPATLTTITGSGGRHLYFKYPLEFQKIESSASKIGNGLDIRANGSYIIAPPSNHLSGNKYQWFGVDTPIEDAPDWLIYEILKSVEKGKSEVQITNLASPKVTIDRNVPDGERNDYLYRQSCGLVNSYPEEEVLRRIKIKNENFKNPLSQKEVERLVKSAMKYKKGKGRDMGMKK